MKNYNIQNVILTGRVITGKEYLPNEILEEVVPLVIYDKSLGLSTVASIWSAYMEALSDTTEANINAVPLNHTANVEGSYLAYVSVLRKLILDSRTFMLEGIKVTAANCYWWDAPWVARTISFNDTTAVTYYNDKAKVWNENPYTKEKIERYMALNFKIINPEVVGDKSQSTLRKLLGVKKYITGKEYEVD